MLVIELDRLRLEVAPELGAGVRSFMFRLASGEWVDIWRPSPPDTSHFNSLACYTLAPWCNRIDRGIFEFAGQTHHLRTNWKDGTAIHGDVQHRPWRISQRTPISARLDIDLRDAPDRNWPWPFTATTRYELAPDQLKIDLNVTNHGSTPMPAGLGLHPFWMVALGENRERMRLEMPLKGRYPCERIMATGPARSESLCARLEVGTEIDEDLDDVFLGFHEARMTWPVSGLSVRMTACPVMTHSVIFHEKGSRWTCIEPVSMVNNGLALLPHQDETGIRIVPPGESLHAEVRFTFSDHAEVRSGSLPLQDRTR